ncbi:MAG TPA: ABC transporter substrate-binding protein [Candidatus Jorgensenbacteria bacterium]|nr:ABC transporter substrate-binding protein [Candidatus Jorgensenbacteria bacterium]
MKKIFIVIFLVIISVGSAVTYKIVITEPTETEKLKITTSFYPLAEFARQVGGKNVEVINITPPGSEPHDYEPTPQDIVHVNSSEIFIFNGSSFDPWAEKIAPKLEEEGIKVLRMTEYFDLIGTDDGSDPHIWLNPILAKQEVEIIRDTLQKIDPTNSSMYNDNAQQYLGKLSELDQKFRTGLASCELREAIVSHAAFGYLAERYDIDIISIAGISPEEEPSLRRLGEIAKLAQEKNINYIFFETLISPKLAETIAQEIGAETLVLNPVEGLTDEEIESGKSYISEMEKNLSNLQRALVCT